MPVQKHRAFHAVNTLHTQQAILDQSSNQIGILVADVQIVESNDLHNLYGQKSYLVACRQRLTIPGCGWAIGPTSLPLSTSPYPAAILHSLVPTFPTNAVVSLLDYSPKTLNTAVVTSNNASSSAGTSSMQQYTSGSSTAQTNSYDVSASLGFFGDLATGGISAGYSHSDTTAFDNSATSGNTSSNDAQSGAPESMTVKDWGGYVSLDSTRVNPTWTWIQEYPWNVADYNATQNGKIAIPEGMQSLLACIPATPKGAAFVFPPSELSTYGVDFVSTACWRVTMPTDAITASDEVAAFVHNVSCYFGWHEVAYSDSEWTVSVSLNSPAIGSVKVDSIGGDPLSMPLLGLAPIVEFEPGNGALIGFVPEQMFYGPDIVSGAFRVMSSANNLYVTGTGFVADGKNQNAVMTTWSKLSAKTPSTVSVYFKITEKVNDITLFLKHWRTAQQGLMLQIKINGSEAIVRHVDAHEASDGSANLSLIKLCSRDLTSVDYVDYLILGLNEITISVVPSEDYSGGECGYALRALAIC